MAAFDTSDVDRLAKDMITEARDVEKRTDRALEESTVWLYGRAISSAPWDEGTLSRSIEMDDNSGDRRRSMSRRVYSDEVHGFMQEYGTSRFPPQPWLAVYAPTAMLILSAKMFAGSNEVLR